MGDSNIIKAAQYAMSGLDKLSLAPALPNPTGSFSVSHSDIEALTPNGTRSFVRLYYPSTEEGSPSKWLPDYEYGAGYGDFLSIPKWIVGGVASSVVGHINIPGGKDSPLEPPPAPATKWPVFVFSHGLATWRSHYSATCNELASRGVVVVSIEHRDGSAIASVAADGDAEANVKYESLDELIEKGLSTRERMREMMVHRRRQLQTRIKESSAALDLVEMLNKGSLTCQSPKYFHGVRSVLESFKGIIDVENPSIGGHSFGGGTCVAAASLDTRFKRVVALDPWLHPIPEEVFKVRPTSKLLFVGASGGRLSSTDYWAQNLSKIRNIARMSGGVKEGDSKNAIDRLQDARVVWLGMKGATHVDFSDIVFFAPNWVYATYDYLLIGPDGLSPAIILNRTMTVAYAFITADIDAKSSVFVDPEYRSECNDILTSYGLADVQSRPQDVQLILSAHDR